MNIEEEHKIFYKQMQIKSGLKVGDKVQITRPAKMHEYGWNNSWHGKMDISVGSTTTITHIDGGHGIRLEIDGCDYPFFVLEKVKKYDITCCYVNDPDTKWMPSRYTYEEICEDENLKRIFRNNQATIYSTGKDKLIKVVEK